MTDGLVSLAIAAALIAAVAVWHADASTLT
jgi:hypothetical protein